MDAAHYSKTWTDAGGVPHDPARAQDRRRIVSLVPSLSETLCAAGGRARLAGITAFCIKPADLLKDPAIAKVGGTKKFSREKLLALQPDLVLVNLEENELEDIDFLKARVECYVNGVKTVRAGIETLREVAALTGAFETGDALAREAEAVLAKIETRVAARRAAGKAPRRVFYPIWRDPWMTVTGDTFIADHLRTLGAEAVPAYDLKTRYPQTTLGEAAAAQPASVWLPSEPFHFQEKDAAEVRAAPGFERARVQLVDGDNVCWFGARQAEGLAYAYETLWGRPLDAPPETRA
ncbi:MAG: ABC transporter substrate-binding protein [Planctomycetota bacterium]|nr:ABC transporter substrate-binding protein [Planctomycetota bacterium]